MTFTTTTSGVILAGLLRLSHSQQRVYNGEVVNPSDDVNFPYHMQLKVDNSVYCGGSLIAPKYLKAYYYPM